MKKHRLLPFRFMPASWGLSGPAYDEAEAAYHYEGEDLARRLADLRCAGDTTERSKQHVAIDLEYELITPYQHDVKMLALNGQESDVRAATEIEFKHGRISEYDFARAVIKMDLKDAEREIALLDLELRYNKIDKRAHEKAVATIKKEPWVGIVEDAFDVNLGLNGFSIELDWNEYWIEYLRLNGYTGRQDGDLVDQWFDDVCRSQGMEPQEPDPVGPRPTRRTGRPGAI